MTAECALGEFLRAGGPERVPLRDCCVVALVSRAGVDLPMELCPRVASATLEAAPAQDPAVVS